MKHLLRFKLTLLISASLCFTGRLMWAESGILVVQIEDMKQRPVAGVKIKVDGGGFDTSDDHGTARIRLATQTKAGSIVSLTIVGSPQNRHLLLVQNQTAIPSFEDDSRNVAHVTVIERGDRAALQYGDLLEVLLAKALSAEAARIGAAQSAKADPKGSLATVAEPYGFSPNDLDQAMRARRASDTDPYYKGLIALYAGNYLEASTNLSRSLQEREKRADTVGIADAALFLGRSLFLEGRFRESSTAYQRALQLRPDDPLILGDAGTSLAEAGDYSSAEPLLRRALEIHKEVNGPNSPQVGRDLLDIASMLRGPHEYVAAESAYRQALSILEKALGRESPEVALCMGNLALVMEDQGNYAEAELLYKRAVAVYEKLPGLDDTELARVLNNLAVLYSDKGDYDAAEPMQRRALAIRERALGLNHPAVFESLYNLGYLLYLKGDFATAESMYQRALAISEGAPGVIDPLLIAKALDSFGVALCMKRDYTAADPLFRRALDMREQILGPEHPDVAETMGHLALELNLKGDLAAAKPLFEKAVVIDEKNLGLNHPDTIRIRRELQALIDEMGP